MSARWQLCAAIEDADVVEPKESARENIASVGIFAIHPPVEVHLQSLEGPLQKAQIFTPQLLLDSKEKECRLGMYRRVHIAEVPLVGWDLTIRVGVEIPQHQQELILGKVEIDQ